MLRRIICENPKRKDRKIVKNSEELSEKIVRIWRKYINNFRGILKTFSYIENFGIILKKNYGGFILKNFDEIINY